MANETRCLTPDAIYHIGIYPKLIFAKIELPLELDIDEEEAKVLETLIHNQIELVLRSYFL